MRRRTHKTAFGNFLTVSPIIPGGGGAPPNPNPSKDGRPPFGSLGVEARRSHTTTGILSDS